VLSFCFAKVTTVVRVTNSTKPVNYNVYLNVTVDDKILFIKRCRLSTVIIQYMEVVSLMAVYTVRIAF
jgi:hypothetical protein